MQGRFITLEGGDGCGKSTQARLLADALEKKGITCRLTREPGGSPLGRGIRQTLLDPAFPDPPVPLAEILLFLADRAQHVATVIMPALVRGEWVLCDRHTDSTLVYQGYARGYDLGILRRLNAVATDGLVPDLTLVFDLPDAERQRRKGQAAEEFGRADRLEGEDDAFQQAVREGFRQLAAAEPARILLFDAAPAPELIHQTVLQAVRDRFFAAGGPSLV